MRVTKRQLTIALAAVLCLVACGDDGRDTDREVGGSPSSAATTGAPDTPTADSAPTSIEVTDFRTTDAVDPSTGEPGPARDEYVEGDEVILWFAFDGGEPADTVTVAWFAEGEEVHASTAALPGSANSMNFTLPGVIAAPGDFRFEVRQGTTVLAEGDFRIVEAQ